MKKYIAVLLIILIPVVVWAFGKGVGGKGIAAKNAGGGSACSGTYGAATTGDPLTHPFNLKYYLLKITLDCDGTATEVSGYVRDSENDTRELVPVIYNDSGGSPSTLVSNGSAVYGFDPGWAVDATFLPELTAGTYWVGVIKESTATETYRYGTDCTNLGYTYDTNNLSPVEDLTSLGAVDSNCWSMRIVF